MITFLNDKEDRELRGSFFDCIIGVAAYIGWPCAGILTPLLLQVSENKILTILCRKGHCLFLGSYRLL